MNIEGLFQIIGEKEVAIIVLQTKIKELEKQLAQLTAQDKKKKKDK